MQEGNAICQLLSVSQLHPTKDYICFGTILGQLIEIHFLKQSRIDYNCSGECHLLIDDANAIISQPSI
jgi:hypothetical protein